MSEQPAPEFFVTLIPLLMGAVGYALILSGMHHQIEAMRIAGALMIYLAGKLSAGWRFLS